MTAAAAPDTQHPLLGCVTGLDELVDEAIACVRLTPLRAGEHAVAVQAVDRLVRRAQALRLRVLAAAERDQVAQDAGLPTTEVWAATQTRSTRAAAAHDVGLAAALADDGDGPRHDPTATALDEGLLSTAHADVIVRAVDLLPAGVGPDRRAQVEQRLVADAQRYDPAQLRRHARRALAEVEVDRRAVDAHENELLHDEEQAALGRSRLTLHDNDDGTTSGHFTVPTLAAAFLRKILDTLTSPRRMPLAPRVPGEEPTWDPAHRRGLAFTELLEHLPVDHLTGRTAATLLVTVGAETLTGALRSAGLETGQDLSAGEARRLACGAGLVPAVLGGPGLVLDLGRAARLFNDTQRTALAAVHSTCAAEGCTRPFAWTELHHLTPWQQGGRTDLANALPLCHWHHRRIHDHHYRHELRADGTVSFERISVSRPDPAAIRPALRPGFRPGFRSRTTRAAPPAASPGSGALPPRRS